MALICRSILVLVSLCIAVSAVSKGDCPLPDNGFLDVFENSCFYFRVNENATYEDAEDDCWGKSGHLAMPKSLKISEFLKQQLTDTYNVSKHVWIGLTLTENDQGGKKETTLQWNDDSPAKVDKNLLASILEYGDILNRTSQGGDYVQMDKGKGNPYVCQYEIGNVSKKISPTPTPTPITRPANTNTTVGKGLGNDTGTTALADKKEPVSSTEKFVTATAMPGVKQIIVIKTVTKTAVTTVTKETTVTVTTTKVATLGIQPTKTAYVSSSQSLPATTREAHIESSEWLEPQETAVESETPNQMSEDSNNSSHSTSQSSPVQTDDLDQSSHTQAPLFPSSSASIDSEFILLPSSSTIEPELALTSMREEIFSPEPSKTSLSELQLTSMSNASEETATTTTSIPDLELLTSQIINNATDSTSELESDSRQIDLTMISSTTTEEEMESQLTEDITQKPEATVYASITDPISQIPDVSDVSSYIFLENKSQTILSEIPENVSLTHPTPSRSIVSEQDSSDFTSEEISKSTKAFGSTTSSQAAFTSSHISKATHSSSVLPSSSYSPTITPTTQKHTVTTLPTTHVTPKDPCPHIVNPQTNMYLFQDKCFYFQLEETLPFKYADVFCRHHGGYLASIKTKKTQSFIEDTLHEILSLGDISILWIGPHKNSTKDDDKYYWMDGEEVTYNNFHKDSPKRDVAALLSSTGSWMPLSRRFPCNYICEFDALIASKSSTPSSQMTSHDHMKSATTSSYEHESPITPSYEYTQEVGSIDELFSQEVEASLTLTSEFAEQITEYITESLETTESILPTWFMELSTSELELEEEVSTSPMYEFSPTEIMLLSSPEVDLVEESTPTYQSSPSESMPLSISETELEEVSTPAYPLNPSVASFFTTDAPSTLPNTTIIDTDTAVTTLPTAGTTKAIFDKPCYQFGDKCFYFQLHERVTFQKANEFCLKYDGSLATIKNKDTQLFIERTLHETLNVKSFFLLWIGLQYNSKRNDGSYYWTDGSLANYTNFQTPPHHHNVVLMSTNGKWVDIENDFEGDFICQFDSMIVTTPKVTTSIPEIMPSSDLTMQITDETQIPVSNTPSSWSIGSPDHLSTSIFAPSSSSPQTTSTEMASNPTTAAPSKPFNKPCHQFRDKCFYFQLEEKLTFLKANEFCQKNAGSLASIKNKDTQSFLEHTLHDTLNVKSFLLLWIGLQRDNDNLYHWMDGESVSFEHFLNTPPKKDAVALLSYSGKWVDISGKYKFAYICEFNSISIVTTPKPTILQKSEKYSTTPTTTTRTTLAFNKKCYQFKHKCFHFQQEEKLTFQQANNYCQKYGGSLALIKNNETQLFIERTLHDTLGINSYSLNWIGLQRRNTANGDIVFYWMDGEMAKYTNFFATLSHNNNFGLMPKNAKWFDVGENSRHNVLCEFDAFPTTPVGPLAMETQAPTVSQNLPVVNKEEMCSKNHNSKGKTAVFKNRCLYFELYKKLSFPNAQTFCKQRGGSLVLIKSEEFLNFLVKQLQKMFKVQGYQPLMWIGLQSDPDSMDDSYHWLDNTSLSYSNFRFSFPMGQYVSMASRSGWWFSQDDPIKNHFICESIQTVDLQN